MGLTVFFALCILGLDFMIFVLFKLFYGDRRSVIARRVAASREAARAEALGLFIVPAKKITPIRKEPDPSAGSRISATEPPTPFAHHIRIA